MGRIWTIVLAFLKKVFKLETLPPEVANGGTLITHWWNVYSSKAPWLPYSFVASDGKNHHTTRRTLGPAKLACSEIAGLVLAEPPEVKAGVAVETVLKDENFWTNLRRHFEYQTALGGMAIKARPVQLSEGRYKIALDFVNATNIIPLASDNKRVYEATFIDRKVTGDHAYVRTETYRRGIESPAEGAAPVAGYIVESKAFDERTNMAIPLESQWPGVQERVFVPIEDPPFVYFKNPEANDIDPESPIGVSAFHSAEDVVKAVDIAFDEFCWEVEAGARRIAIPGTCLRGYIDPETDKLVHGFNPGDRVFLRLEGDDAEKFKPTDLTSDIRAESFIATINYFLNLFSIKLGFDAGYFSFDGTSVKTATEVIAENSHTYKTREAYRDALNEGLVELFNAINALAKLYAVEGSTDKAPEIKWDDGVIEDRNSKANYHAQLVQTGLEDRESAIKAVHGLDDAGAAAMAAKIKAEKQVVTDPFGAIS